MIISKSEMNMPNTCKECPFSESPLFAEWDKYCSFAGKTLYSENCIPKECPLPKFYKIREE